MARATGSGSDRGNESESARADPAREDPAPGLREARQAETARRERLAATPVADHFVVGVYPFFHTVRVGEEPVLRQASNSGPAERDLPEGLFGAAGLWEPWLSRLPQTTNLNVVGAFDDSYFFLPHIRSFLYPEFHIHGAQAPDTLRREITYDERTVEQQLRHRAAELQSLSAQAPGRFAALAPKGRLVHLTLKADLLRALAPLTLEAEEFLSARTAGASPLWIDLWLFPYGIGQLVLAFQTPGKRVGPPEGPAATTLEGLDAILAILPLVQPRYVGDGGFARIRAPGLPAPLPLRTLVDYLLQGVAGDAPTAPTQRAAPVWRPITDLGAYALRWRDVETSDRAAATSGTSALPYSLTSEGQVYGARMLTYAYLRSPHTEDRPDLGIPGWCPAGPYDHAWQQLGLETALRTKWLSSAGGTSADARAMEVADDWGRRRAIEDHVFQRYGNWAALAYDESFLAVATRSDFFNSTWSFGLTKNLYHDYLALFIYTVFVRFALLKFTKRMQEPGGLRSRLGPGRRTERDDALERLRVIHQHFLLFRRSHWFARATSRDQGEELRALMMRALGVEADYGFIEQTLDDVVETLEVRGERERNRSLYVLSAVVAPLSLVLAFYSSRQVSGWNEWLAWGTLPLLLWASYWTVRRVLLGRAAARDDA